MSVGLEVGHLQSTPCGWERFIAGKPIAPAAKWNIPRVSNSSLAVKMMVWRSAQRIRGESSVALF